MRPVDPRMLRRAGAVRGLLVALVALGTADAVLFLVQATVLADLVSRLVVAPRSKSPYGHAIAALVAAAAGRAVIAWARETCAARTGAAVKGVLRLDLVRHLVAGPARAAGRSRTGQLAVLATDGIDALDGYFARYLPQLVLACVVPVLVGARIFAADPVSAVVIAATVPLIPVFMVLIGLKTRDHMARRLRALERLGGHFVEVVAGLPTLVAFGRAKGQTGAIRRAADAHRKATMRTLRVAFLSSLALELIAMMSVAMVAVGIGLRLANGSLDLRTGLLVLICAPEVYLPLRLVGARYHEAAEGLAAADAVFSQTAEAGPEKGTTVPDTAAVIEFCDVTISREDRAADAVHGLSFELLPGTVTGLTGPSGAGKSTLIHLLLGLDQPTGGRITVGGTDLRDCDLDAWRAGIAWLPQNPRLTGGTVAEAIRLGAPDASEEEVAHAARRAGIDFRLDAAVGESGAALSGGQARRVALARAILRDAPIVLLDEPTEHLDTAAERAITAALRDWLPGRTALVVTHRPALLELCDRIVHLDAPGADPDAAGRFDSPVEIEPPATAPSGAASPGPEPESEPGREPKRELEPGPERIGRHLAVAIVLGGVAALCSVGLAASSAWLIATAAGRPPLLTLQVGIAAVQAFGLGRAVSRYGERLAGHDATLRLLARLRVRVYRGLVNVAPAGMAAERRGDLLANLTSDVTAVQDLFLKTLLPAGAAFLAALGLLVFDVFLLPGAAAVLLAGVCLAGLGAPAATWFLARRAARRTQTARAELCDDTVAVLDALPDLVAYGAAAGRVDRIAHQYARLAGLERRGALAAGLGTALVTLASGATVGALAVTALDAVRSGRLGGPMAATLVLAPLALFEILAGLPDAARAVDRGRSGWARLSRIAAAPALVPVPAHPVPLAWASGSHLDLDRVTACWPGSDRPAVREVSVRLQDGEQITLTGPSGSGKSTTSQLAARGLDPIAGSIRINGVDLRAADPDAVRDIVVVCDQDAHLFDATIRENLLIGHPAAAEPALWHALSLVLLDQWVARLPRGLDTPVGQLGDAVSGGERRRIALARALLAPAPVLVLDEPFAHLDAETAASVEDNLRRELTGRTVLWIRHATEPLPSAETARQIRTFGPTARQVPIDIMISPGSYGPGSEPSGDRPMTAGALR